LWYCPTHAAAFEMLETLRLALEALDKTTKHVPATNDDLSLAMDATMRVRALTRKAAGTQ
jgi:hypothetical protein